MINVRVSGDAWTDVSVPLPNLSGEGRFRIKAPSTIRCATPRVLLDGTPLAIDVTKVDGGVIEVAAGPVVGGTLTLAVRAVPPITASSQGLRIECDDAPPVLVSLSLSGAVRFVPGRSGWTVPASVAYGDIVTAALTLRNDGTIDLERGRVALEVTPGAVPAFKSDNREVDENGRRVVHIDVPALAVRESTEVLTPLFITDAALQSVKLRALVLDAEGNQLAAFESDPVKVFHKNAPQVVAHLLDGERLRFGDEIRTQVNLVQAGAPIPDARLTVDGNYIEPMAMELGPLQHNERRTIPISLRLRRAASSEHWEDRVFLRLHSSAMDRPATYNIELPCSGRAMLRMDVRVGEADGTGAYRVDVVLENRGDGIAASPLLRAERTGDIRAVVDSLVVDGAPQYELDGSVPIFDSGIRLKDIELGQRRVVSFAIRAAHDTKTELKVSVFSASVESHAVVITELLGAAKRTMGAYALPPAEVSALTAAPPEQRTIAPLEAVVPDAVPSMESAKEEAEEARLVFPTEWNTYGREYLDDGQVPLGRHVLALLSWLPTSATGNDGLDTAARALYAAVEAVQLLGLPPMRGGFWGVSGVAIATTDVREAAEGLAKAQNVEYPGGGQLTALRWLAVQVEVPEALKSWQQAVINALVNADSDEALTELMTYTLLEVAA